MRVEFEVKVANNTYTGYALALKGSIILWVGKSNIGTMGLAHFPVSTLLLETPGTHGICVKGLSTMIAKSFKDKQVFVSSDLEEEDPSFWQQLFAEIKPHLEPLFLEKRMETVSIS